jgi:hypothetical protein
MRTRLRSLVMALLLPVLGSCAAAPPAEHPPDSSAGAIPQTHADDCKRLMLAMVPAAREMLTKSRAIFPFGATMSPTGVVTQTDGPIVGSQAQADNTVGQLEAEFRAGARLGRYRATALAHGIRVVPPGKSHEQDAIEVRLDHRDGYSERVLIPYSFVAGNQLRVEAPFTAPGGGRIFER